MTEREHMIHSIARALHVSEEIGIDIIQVSDDAARKLLELLKEQPTIVRCKDCRYGESVTNILGEDRVKCNLSDSFVYRDITLPPDWYCADWEVKQDDSV